MLTTLFSQRNNFVARDLMLMHHNKLLFLAILALRQNTGYCKITGIGV